MSQVPPTNILAKSTFSQPSTQNMAQVDVYTTDNPGVVNSIQDQESKEDSSLKVSAIRGSKFLKSIMPFARTVLSDGTSILNATSGKQRLTAMLNGSSRAFASLPDSYKNLFPGDPKTIGTSLVTVGNVSQKVLNTNFSSIQSSTRLLGDLSGDPSLVGVQDEDSLIAMTSTVAKEASRTRVPNSIPSLINTLGSSQLINKFASKALPATLTYSDSLGLKDLATSAKPGDINLLNPNFAGDFTTQYGKPPECTANDYKTEHTNVMDAFSSVNSKWDSTKRAYDAADSVNLTPLVNSSDDMKKVLQAGYMDSNNPNLEMRSLADMYSQESVSSSLANQYPNTYLMTGDQRAKLISETTIQ